SGSGYAEGDRPIAETSALMTQRRRSGRTAGSAAAPRREEASLLADEDLYLFNEGTHAQLYQKLGAHPVDSDGQRATYFAVWAPNASAVSVVGDFNEWEPGVNPLKPRATSGIWEGDIPTTGPRAIYKLHIASLHAHY